MLPEILSISVPAEVLALAPSSYSGFSAHAETVRQRKQQLELQEQNGDNRTRLTGRSQRGDDDSGESESCEMSHSTVHDSTAAETAVSSSSQHDVTDD